MVRRSLTRSERLGGTGPFGIVRNQAVRKQHTALVLIKRLRTIPDRRATSQQRRSAAGFVRERMTSLEDLMVSARFRRTLAIIVFGLVVAAGLPSCTSTLVYKPLAAGSRTGGYSEEQLGPNRWRLMYSGWSLRSRSRIENYLMFRAAELTHEQGMDWLEVVEPADKRALDTDAAFDEGFAPWPVWQPVWSYYDSRTGWHRWTPWCGERFWAETVSRHSVTRFNAEIEIIVHQGAMPSGDRNAFDAQGVIKRLEPTIDRDDRKRGFPIDVVLSL
jgi:hypothetical protein